MGEHGEAIDAGLGDHDDAAAVAAVAAIGAAARDVLLAAEAHAAVAAAAGFDFDGDAIDEHVKLRMRRRETAETKTGMPFGIPGTLFANRGRR